MKIDYDAIRAQATLDRQSQDRELEERLISLRKLSVLLEQADYHVQKLHEVDRYLEQLATARRELDTEGFEVLPDDLRSAMHNLDPTRRAVRGALTGYAETMSQGLVAIAKAVETI